MKFSYIDFFLFGGLAVAAYSGYRGGLSKKLFNLLALIGSVVIATQLMHPVGEFFIDVFLMSESLGYVLAFALVVCAGVLTTILLYKKFGKSSSSLTSSSQYMGTLLGLFEGAIVISLLLLALRVFEEPENEARRDSIFYRPLVNFTPKTFDLLRSYLPGAGAFREELSRTFKDSGIFDNVPGGGKKN